MALYRQDVVDKYLAMGMCPELENRALVASNYWLNASAHERTEEDGVILAHYARVSIAEKMIKKEEASLPQGPPLRQVKEGSFGDGGGLWFGLVGILMAIAYILWGR